jgi:hypothetical protein
MYDMWGSHRSEDGYHQSTRLHVITSWKTIILTTVSTPVTPPPRWKKIRQQTGWALQPVWTLRGGGRERNPWLCRNWTWVFQPLPYHYCDWAILAFVFLNWAFKQTCGRHSQLTHFVVYFFFWPEIECYLVNKLHLLFNKISQINVAYHTYILFRHHNTLKPEIQDHEMQNSVCTSRKTRCIRGTSTKKLMLSCYFENHTWSKNCLQATEFYDVKPWSLCSSVPGA